MSSCNCWKWLVLVGGLNWGLTGIGMLASSELNVIKLLVGAWPTVEAVIYILVGIGAVIMLYKKA